MNASHILFSTSLVQAGPRGCTASRRTLPVQLLVGFSLGAWLHVSPAAQAGTGAPVLTAYTACPWGSDDCNVCVADAVDSIVRLRDHGDPLGFHMNGAPDVIVTKHWQGVQRLMSGGGNYLAVSRSLPEESTDVSFVIVEMASRNDEGVRFRSNRLIPSRFFEDTPPPLEDGIIDVIPHEPGFTHAGGLQLLGNILAVPFEEGDQSKVVLYDLVDPPFPVRLPNEIDHSDLSGEAGTASLGKLADGRFLLIIGRANANTLDFYVSTGTDPRTTGFEWFDTWNEDDPDTDFEFGNYQNLNILAQCDGTLYLIGTHENTNFGGGQDFVDLFRLENATGNDVKLTKVANKHLFCDYRGVNNCNFDAAGGIYVDPAGQLFIYGTEHDNDGPIEGTLAGFFCSGPDCSVKMAEFRPVPHGPCERIQDAWVELYDDNGFGDRSVMIDFVDRDLENYSNLNQVEDIEDRPSSVRWCIPPGAEYRLWEDRGPCSGDTLDLVGHGFMEAMSNLDDVGFGDDASCSEWLGGPFADAGDDQTVECASHTTTPVPLDGTGSVSLNDAMLSFSWSAPTTTFDDPTSTTPIGQFPKDFTVVTLTVSEGPDEHSDTAEVRVVDTTPPQITCPTDAEVVCGAATDATATGEATATDVCDAEPLVDHADNVIPAINPLDPVQDVIERTWTALDDSSNPDQCVQRITVLKRELSLDIKPGACPNPIELRARGTIPMSLLGAADFDVTTVDIASLLLLRADGVGDTIAPTSLVIQDTSSPFQGPLCGCERGGGDEILDLSLRFDNVAVVSALQLGTVAPTASVELVLVGTLSDGCEFIAADCMIRVPVKER